MRTVQIQKRIESDVQDAGLLSFCSEDNDEEYASYMSFSDMSSEQQAKVARRLKVSVELLEGINDALDNIRQAAHQDLAEIWKRQDEYDS